MNQQTVVDEKAKRKLKKVDTVDILVGIPSYNNERTIAHVVKAVQCGLAKYFPRHTALIEEADERKRLDG